MEYSEHIFWAIPLLILFAGINLPFSIDILIMSGAAIAAIEFPQFALPLFLLYNAAAIISAWEAYWLGRLIGPKIIQLPLMHSLISLKKIERLHVYYEKYGVWTFLIARFIPGGVRNALFMSSGMGKMPFQKFVLRDLLACTLSVAVLFNIGFWFGTNVDLAIALFKKYQLRVVWTLLILACIFITYRLVQRYKR